MIRLALALLVTLASPLNGAVADKPGLAALCGQIGNDDTIHPYDPSLNAGLLKAYAQLFPQAPVPPSQQAFEAGAHIRCMNRQLLACFTGANLPCAKMNPSRDSEGADAFCRANPQAQVVPAFAVGHDSAYAYHCVSGQAQIVGETFPLDARGFAESLWAPIN